MGVAGPMAIKNRLHLGDVALASSGARMSGSAGMEFIEVALGRQVVAATPQAHQTILAMMAGKSEQAH